MLKWLGAVALVAAAVFCIGFSDNVDTSYRYHKVRSGETLNGIAARYYHENTKGYISQNDYAMMVRVQNNKLYNLDRQLQIGDIVCVPIYTQK